MQEEAEAKEEDVAKAEEEEEGVLGDNVSQDDSLKVELNASRRQRDPVFIKVGINGKAQVVNKHVTPDFMGLTG